MNDTSRPPRPPRRLPNVEAVWSRKARTWCWRARVERTIDGRRRIRVGTHRRDQERAAQDAELLRAGTRAAPGLLVTLGDAIAAVLSRATARGVTANTVNACYGGHARYLLQFWKPETHLAWIDVEEVLWFVQSALDAGRHPNTLRGKDLPILARCFAAAELASPVPEALRQLDRTLRPVPARIGFLTPDELAETIHRMRTEVFTDGDGRPLNLPAREYHADLVALLACTGVRVLELSRVTLEDVDLAKREIRVEHAKDKGNPRRLFLGANLGPIVERLAAHAEAEHAAGRNDGRAFVPQCRSTMVNVARRWSARLGRPVNGRLLRHSFVTGVLLEGGSVYDARVLAGHRSLKSTDRYVGELHARRPVLERLESSVLGTAAEVPAR